MAHAMLCHGSDSASSARRELGFFFSVGSCAPEVLLRDNLAQMGTTESPAKVATTDKPPSSPPKRYAGMVRAPPQINKADLALMEAYANYDVEPVMSELLQNLMVTRPKDVTGFALQTLASNAHEERLGIAVVPCTGRSSLEQAKPYHLEPTRYLNGW